MIAGVVDFTAGRFAYYYYDIAHRCRGLNLNELNDLKEEVSSPAMRAVVSQWPRFLAGFRTLIFYDLLFSGYVCRADDETWNSLSPLPTGVGFQICFFRSLNWMDGCIFTWKEKKIKLRLDKLPHTHH